MKKKVLSVLCVVALLLGVLGLGAAVSAADGIGNLKVGYAIVSIDPADAEGTYRTINYTTIYNESGNDSLKADIDAAVAANDPAIKMVKDTDGKVTSVLYTVQPLKDEVNGGRITSSDNRYERLDKINLSALPEGYFSMPLSGYGSTNTRLSIGKMDDNGDGVIDGKDGNFMTCIAVTDAEGETMLFFSLDAITSEDFASDSVRDQIRDDLKKANAAYDVTNANMMFSASHTHSGPDSSINNSYALNINAAQIAYRKLLIGKAKEAAIAAMADRSEVTVSTGEVEATNMNATRHYTISEKKSGGAFASWVHGDNFGPSLPSDKYVDKDEQNGTGSYTSGSTTYTVSASNVSQSDETMYLIQFTPKDGKDPIVMVNFRAHPKLNSASTLGYGGDNKYSNSCDYVGALREKLAKYNFRASYIQGASGNQNTWNYLDDTTLTPGVQATSNGSVMYNEIMAYREPDGISTENSYNDTLAFFKYTNSKGKTYNAQSGFSYGARLADYALQGLYKNMTTKENGLIKANQTVYTGTGQTYSEGLRAAVADYDKKLADYEAGKSDTAPSFPYKYQYVVKDESGDQIGGDGKYYNLNSIYHANAVRGRATDASKIDAKLVLNCITIGPLAFVSAPCELYDRYNDSGDQVNDNLWDTFNATAKGNGYIAPMVLGYTNGHEGYVPNAAAYNYNMENNEKGSVERPTTGTDMIMGVGAYEANNTKFASGSGEQIVAHFQETLLGMKDMDRTSVCPMCGQENVQWGALSSPGATSIYGGHYYLADDLVGYAGTVAGQRLIYADTCIDLNGHTAGNSAADIGRAFYVVGGNTLRMMNGTVEGRGSNNDKNGGVIYTETNASVYLTDVDVIRETHDGQTTAYGGAIYLNQNAKLYMENGTVSGGTAGTGGNIYAYTGATLDLDSVTLENGTATGKGDNICCWSPNVHIYGDSVLKGECYFSNSSAKTKFSGNVQAFESPDGENIKLAGGTRLTFGELSDTAKISVQGSTSITDTTGIKYAGKQLIPDNGFYLDDTVTTYGVFAGDKWMCECGGMAADKHTCEYHAYAAWSTNNSLPTFGNYYLATDVITSAQASPNATHKVLRLDLAGHSITHKVTAANAKATCVFKMSANTTLAITDTVGAGALKRDLSNLTSEQVSAITNYGPGVCVNNGGSFRLYGGTIDLQGQSTSGGGAVAGITTNSVIEIYGGAIKNFNSTGYGGGIYSKGTVKLLGGSITGNTAAGGAGVYLGDSAARLILSGNANVTGNYKTDGATANNISASSTQLTVSGTYTGTAGLVVSSPALNKVVGIADNVNISGATLTVDGSDAYRFAVSGNSLKLTASADAVVMDAIGNTYNSVAAALEEYTGSDATLTLLQNVAENIILTQNTAIDLAGCSITGTVSYKNDAKLILSDANTTDYTVQDGKGYGTVPYSANVVAADDHLLYVEGSAVSAHAYDVRLTGVVQRAKVAGMYFTSKFQGDEIIKDMVSEFGISLRVNKAPDKDYILADTERKTHTLQTQDSWVVGTNPANFYGTVLENVMLPSNGYSINKRNANMPVYGVPYIRLEDESFLFGTARTFTLKELTKTADGMNLNDTQLGDNVKMYAQYKSVMSAWDIPQIKAAYQQLTGTVTIEGTMIPETLVTAKAALLQTDAQLVYEWSVDGKILTGFTGETCWVPVTAAGKKLAVTVKPADETKFSGSLKSEEVVVGAFEGTKMTFAGLYSDVKILGRTPIDGTGISTAWPGTGFSIRVKGNGTPLKLGVNTGTTSTYFCVEVDGVQVDRVKFLNTMEYTLNLTAGEHTVTFFRDSANTPKVSCKLEYIDFAGEILEKPADKELYIEVIGDSIASGLGSLGTYTQGVNWVNEEHSVSNSFGWYVAQDFNADVSVIAKGGIGAVKTALDKNMVQIYPYVNGYTGTTAYDFARKPDLVIVELGANDGSSTTEDYTAGLTAVYQMIFANYGEDTKILWVGNNSRFYNVAASMSDTFGDSCYALLYKYGVGGSGPAEGTAAHPNKDDHRAWADVITQYIRDNNLMG